jgi:hypothetical protein
MAKERKGVEIIGGTKGNKPRGVERINSQGKIQNKEPEILDRHRKQAERDDGA